MRRSYWILFLAILGLAVALTVVGRSHRGQPAARAGGTAAPAPWVTVTVDVAGGAIQPPVTSVPKDHRVRLTVRNHDARVAVLSLSGYEDRVQIPPLRPREHWTGEFLADRPGEDFAWVLNGEPAGRLAVTGQHLIEGHR